jgi:hypothetical protein
MQRGHGDEPFPVTVTAVSSVVVIVASPVVRSSDPPATARNVLLLQVEIPPLAVGIHGPALHPMSVQSLLLPVCAGVVDPRSHVPLWHLAVRRFVKPLGSGASGTLELPPPVDAPPHVSVCSTVPPGPPALVSPHAPPGGVKETASVFSTTIIAQLGFAMPSRHTSFAPPPSAVGRYTQRPRGNSEQWQLVSVSLVTQNEVATAPAGVPAATMSNGWSPIPSARS